MAIRIGERLGSHEVTALLGRGGMGEVYRARDSRLKRDVAIKTLPEEFAGDPDRLSRFQREAEVLASLNHPNIAAIYGLEDVDGTRCLILELVEGDTLADTIVTRGALPLAEALDIARQICEALEAAHDKGIVHRDLKPANVKVMPDGKVKVLDFGLAKALDGAPTSSSLSMSPTMGATTTHAGLILGTAAYMSPEQARGRALDRRSDIFAFGCVLFEMLTGKRAFGGDDVTEVLGRVVTGEPDWSGLPADTPRAVRRVLQRALKKDPRQRLGDIRDARLDIDEAETESTQPAAVGRGSRWAWGAFAAAVLVAAALGVPAAIHWRESGPAEVRLEINTPLSPAPLHFALSPDGRYIAFVAAVDGPQQLWLRALDQTDAQPLPGTDGAEYPFWSKNSRSIAFFSSGKLQRIDVGGKQPVVITDAPTGRGGAWNADGTIVFSPAASSVPLLRVAASGGEPTPVTHLGTGHLSHRYPNFLPDGQRFLFFVQGQEDVAGMYLGSLDGGEPKRLASGTTAGVYLKPDLVIYARQGALVARRLDAGRGELIGDPMTLADKVGYDPTFNLGAFSASDDGSIAYRSATAGTTQLTWYDRDGRQVGHVGGPDSTGLLYPELSPDDRQLAVTRTVQNNTDIWLLDLVRGGQTPVTTDVAVDNSTVWSPDGSRIVFSSTRGGKAGTYNLYTTRAGGGAPQDSLLETPMFKVPQDWSKDGFVLYFETGEKTGRDLWAYDLNARKARPVANSRFEESLAQFSPDGRWIAYQTSESGRFEIVVQAFPDAERRWTVSTGGGRDPRWRADGKELYFIAPDGKLTAARVSASGSTFESGTPAALFPLRVAGGASNLFRPQYDVSRDGRFLVNQLVEETPITLVLNWTPPK